MKKVVTLAALGAMVAVAGCAPKSANIAAAYVSPVQYANYSCQQIGEEAQSLSAHAQQVMGVQDKKAGNDAVAMGVGLVLFWPALFFLHPNAATTQEVAQLKGQMNALQEESIRKNCGIVFQREPGMAASAQTAQAAAQPAVQATDTPSGAFAMSNN